MARTISIIKWLCALGAIALTAFAGLTLARAMTIRDVMVNGKEVMALVEGGVRAKAGETYAVDLVWQDDSGAARRATVAIGAALAKQLEAGKAGDPPGLLIRYLPDAQVRAPVVVRQAADDQEANRQRMIASLIGAGISILAFAIFAVRERRRALQKPGNGA